MGGEDINAISVVIWPLIWLKETELRDAWNVFEDVLIPLISIIIVKETDWAVHPGIMYGKVTTPFDDVDCKK